MSLICIDNDMTVIENWLMHRNGNGYYWDLLPFFAPLAVSCCFAVYIYQVIVIASS